MTILTKERYTAMKEKELLTLKITEKEKLLHKTKDWRAKLTLIDQILVLKKELWGNNNVKTNNTHT